MPIVFEMRTLSTKHSCLLKGCRAAQNLVLSDLGRINTVANVLVYSISERAWLQFCARVKLNCLRLYCFEQS